MRSAMSAGATKASGRGALPDARLALRHGARCRQMGRAAGRDHGDRLRRRSQPPRQAPAVRDRGDRLCRRGGRALRLDAARQPRGGRHLRRERPEHARPRRRVDARCARRSSASIPIISARPRGPGANCSPISNCTSSRGRCWKQQNLPVGVVTAIAGATRLAARLTGMAGHAGTVPMALRRDALAGAAECIGAIEQFCRTDEGGLVGTVGYIQARPGATNVIPGEVSFTIDMRAPTDMHRKRAVADVVRQIEAIAKRRQSGASARRHPREPHRALRALAEGPDRAGDRRRRRFACSSCRAGQGTTAWR